MSKKSKKAVTEAIQDSGGIVLEIARRLDISWATAKTYIEKWEDTKALFEDESEKVLDIAEQTIIKSIKAGDTSDAKWLLSRKGKGRGYVERQEITGEEGKPIIFQVIHDEQPIIQNTSSGKVSPETMGSDTEPGEA